MLDGKSVLELYEVPFEEMNVDYTDLCQYLELFDYPGSRDPIEKSYTYTYGKDVHRPLRQGTGMNMVGLHAPSEVEWGIFLKDDYFRVVADAGFEMVRIPCRFESFINSTQPVRVNTNFLARVDRSVKAALENNFSVLLEVHYYPDKDIIRRLSVVAPGLQKPVPEILLQPTCCYVHLSLSKR